MRIQPGTFEMGSPSSEEGRDDDETRHTVTITRAFLLQATEVTQGQWRALMGTSPAYFPTCGDACPVEQVSWSDAVMYLNALSRSNGLDECYSLSDCTGAVGGGCAGGEGYCFDGYDCAGVRFTGLSCSGYRLPTESKWEYAARAGSTSARHGDVDDVAWTPGNSGGRTHSVGGLEPNAWGLYDMLGNVWEWTHDWYGSYGGSATDPTGPATGSGRVGRGGSWGDLASGARAASRSRFVSRARSLYLGFRPARSLP